MTMYRRGINPSRADDAQCAGQLKKLRNTLFRLWRRGVRFDEVGPPPRQRRGLRDARTPLLEMPLIDYIHRVVLPTVRCPRVFLWLRVRALQYVPPDVAARDGADYILQLLSTLGDDHHEDRFFAGWEDLYNELRDTESALLAEDFAHAGVPALPWR
jgi:hypothetical protein